ncbi:SCL-interrupting locus protein-like protein [Harpegnathos saltator]|uniref:SCL-interrupting locus protein-like protein n=1 Tax=Harpegnathos saltator TaxID=610380 RepID=E2C588_HARSA|nr:SCL-interrupting locus protein-like protein [Harpegnathos saltator]
MHYQMYDVEEEFEPRIIPKPTTKLDHFTMPSVPEVSLIFEKPIRARNLNDGDIGSSSVKSTQPVQSSDKSKEHINIASNSDSHNSYTVHGTSSSSDIPDSYTSWKQQIYSRENNHVNTTRVPPLRKNVYSYNHASQSAVQDAIAQKPQEQDKICDTQNRLINMRPNDGIQEKSVKFKCSDMENPHSHKPTETLLLSSDKRQLLSCNPLQKATCVTDPAARMPSNVFVDALKQNEHLQIPYTSCPYPLQQFYPPSYSSRDVDNNETVKTLLQLVNSQSEQIKTLQSQVDRLVRLQEESFRSKSTCACSSSHANQVFGYSAINCYDTRAQSHNQVAEQTAGQNLPVTENKSQESYGGDRDNSKLEMASSDQQPKKAFMEQKVSIGVMTSFEFTVQNSPFLVDSEVYEEKRTVGSAGETDDINRRNVVNVHDTPEPVKRYKNTFTRKLGTAQLENIVEDTESYLSSSHQQSSNFNASSSARDSGRHTPKQSDPYNTTNISESPKMHRRHAADLNREKVHEKETYIRESDDGDTDEQIQDIRTMPSAPRYIERGSKNASYDKAFVVNDVVNNYTATDRENSNERPSADRKNPRTHTHTTPTTNYYQSHRNKESNANVREAKNVNESIALSGGDLRIFERPPPTPEPSIHVEMQEYTSDDESDKVKRTSKIGWTFYNNVLGQVNELLQNSSVTDDKEHHETKISRGVEQDDDTEATRVALHTVKAATLEQLRKLGIDITDKEHKELNDNSKTVDFDSSYYPRLDHQANMMHATSIVNDTNTSMHMKALALKYLSDEELTDIALHKQGSSSLKHLMLSNMQGTNLSFATMRYLERYQLLPGRNQDVQTADIGQVYAEVASKRTDFKPTTAKNSPALRQFPFVRTPGTTCPSRILDISTLKRQPKLL